MNSKPPKPKAEEANQSDTRPFCGIIMPIAAMPNYEKSHWDRVRIILDEAIVDAGYQPRLVSESEDIGVIHGNIVQNLYDDPIVVCDVSAKNPNVMFELGMRLAFDKPTIIIKDDRTDYSFDTGPIKHINYRADLRFDDVRQFTENVAVAIKASVAKKDQDTAYSPFLGYFHRVKVTNLQTKEVNSDEYMISQMKALQNEIAVLSTKVSRETRHPQFEISEVTQRLVIENLVNDIVSQSRLDVSQDVDLRQLVQIVRKNVIKNHHNVDPAIIDETVRTYIDGVLHSADLHRLK